MKIAKILIMACLGTNSNHSMNLMKIPAHSGNPQLASLLFCRKAPSWVLKNQRSFGHERDEQFKLLEKIISPKVITFVRNNPIDTMAQSINRSLNLTASKMAYFIGENDHLLNQDLLSENSPHENPLHTSLNVSARASRGAMALLLPMDYFLSRQEFVEKVLGDKTEQSLKAFERSIEQLGNCFDEIAYIDEGKVLSVHELQSMHQKGLASNKEQFFHHFKRKIKKANITELVDEEADITTAALLKNSEKLQELREASTAFNVSQETAMTILHNEQAGCGFAAIGFSFDCNNESQTMVYAIADHKEEMLKKIHTSLETMLTGAQALQIDDGPKKLFLEECEEAKELIERACARVKKLGIILPQDAKKIGPRSYTLSNMYGTLRNLGKNNNEAAQRCVIQSALYKLRVHE